MGFDPKPGDIVYYDFQWADDARSDRPGKDRPCAVVIATSPEENGNRRLVLAGISHSPPHEQDRAVEIPAKVGRHLGFDDAQSWIKTNTLNVMQFSSDRVPVGVVPSADGEFIRGRLPKAISQAVYANVQHHMQQRTLERVRREAEALPRPPVAPQRPAGVKPQKPSRPTLTLPQKRDDRER